MDRGNPIAPGPRGRARRREAMTHAALPFLALLVVGIAFPLFGGGYWGVIATRACVYWVLVSGLNLVVGFAGQIAIGWVALLTLGAYTTSVLVAGNVMPALPPYLALAIAGVVGAVFGLIVGLPALRLRTFYFAITTLGFATIVTQVALAWQSVTGGGVGVPGRSSPSRSPRNGDSIISASALAAICTWMTANIAASRFGRALTAVRDAEVAAEASGICKARLLGKVFLFSGAVAAVAGGLFASLQSYITPDAFTIDLSVLFFIAILIGGHGSILGPLLGTILLTVLPEFAAPLVAWSTFLYAVLLLVIVLVIPGGIAEILDFKNRRPLESDRAIVPRPDLLGPLLGATPDAGALTLEQVALSFGGVRAIDGLDLEIRAGQVHGLIGPNGSGKTTTLNVISGYYVPKQGAVRLNGAAMTVHGLSPARAAADRANVSDPAHRRFRVSAGERHDRRHDRRQGDVRRIVAVAAPPSTRRSDAARPRHAGAGGSRAGAARRCARRPAAAQRVALHGDRPRVDAAPGVPAARRAGGRTLGRRDQSARRADAGDRTSRYRRAGGGTSPDLIFDICHHVTVLNLGKILAAGTPAEIRSHREVVNAYLGA